VVTGVHSLSLKVLLAEEGQSFLARLHDVGVDHAVPVELLST
jgi:hypothetical protein